MNRLALAVLLAGLAVFAAGCGKKEADKPLEKSVNVTTAMAVKKDLSITESAVGSSTSLGVAQALDPNSVRRGTVTIRLPFPEHVARQLRIGQSVRLTSFDAAAKTATARVKEIRPALNSSTQTMEVIAELPAGQEWYSIGSVRGEVVVAVRRGAIVVPETAVSLIKERRSISANTVMQDAKCRMQMPPVGRALPRLERLRPPEFQFAF